MINNEFHLIGIAVSDFEKTITPDTNYEFHFFRLEVEKVGMRTGTTFEIDVLVYAANKKINITQKILGRQIAVNGFLDSYTNKQGLSYAKVIAQSILILDGNRAYNRYQKPKAVIASTNDANIEVEEEE